MGEELASTPSTVAASSPEAPGASGDARHRARAATLYGVVLLLATTGLAYELALGTVDSMLLGGPVTHFAMLIGLYMAALGLGALLSERLKSSLELRFVDCAIATGAIGGGSAPLLFFAFGTHAPFRPTLYAITLLVGALVGLQLPLLMRVLRRSERFADVVARALAVDYVGALVGSLTFSLVLIPTVGLVRSTVVLGVLNIAAAVYVQRAFGRALAGMGIRLTCSAIVAAMLAALWSYAGWFEELTEQGL